MPFLRSAVKIPLRALIIRFGLIYLPIAAILTLALLTSIRLDSNIRLERVEMRESARVEIAQDLLARDFSVVTSELRILAKLPSLREYLDSGKPAQRDELAKLFLVVAQESRRYDQLRFIDTTGKEVIRINYNAGKPFIVPPEQLQDKSQRYFFLDTIKLAQDEAFVSPLDLNIEHDRLEIPYKPMIRFGTPVFDSAGAKRGVILLNYLGDVLLQDFREAMQGGDPHSPMLLNRDGYWLSSNRREEEWGFMLGRDENTFGRDFAEEWRAISAGERGTLQTTQGLFVYATVYPLQAGQYSSSGSALPRASSQHELIEQEYHWKIVSFVPQAVLVGMVFYHQASGLILVSVIYLLLALASGLIGYVMLSRKQIRAALRENEARLREITETMSDGLLVMNQAGHISFANAEASLLLGHSAETLLGADMHELIHVLPDGSPCPRNECKILQIAQTGGSCIAREETFKSKAGRLLPVTVSAAAIIREQERIGVVVAFHDISERKQDEEALRRSFEEIEDLYDHAPCGYHSLDENGLFVRINHTELEWLGYRRGEVINKMRFSDLLTPASLPTFQESFPRFKELGYVHDLEFELMRKDGTRLPILLSATAVRDTEGHFLMSRSILVDLRERKKLERELERQARIDVLTGLNNRRHFFELAEQELARARRYEEALSLLLLDVDYFKSVNDVHGHHVGDAALRALSEACARTLREIDILGRLGGEEFAMLLPETTGEQALEVAERIRRAVAQAAVPLDQGGPLHFTVSIGLASLVAADSTIDATLMRADKALYAAKNAGRNRVCAAKE
ncbi:MAG: diguanylate cyclase [Methylococcaceae bacterium]|nr:diguanylate cyclase [Methylococcaceae bacterium]